MNPILVVEDDDDIREMISELLEREGYQVDQARDGNEALTYLRRPDRAPCVVLLDLLIPVLDGWQLLTIMQQDDRMLTIPVAVVSASTDARPLPAGIRVLKKPVAVEVLMAAVREYCGVPPA